MVFTHTSQPYFEIRVSSFIFLLSMLPIGSFVTCVLLSIALHWDGATRTHCNVTNYIPSISAATGDYSPEKYIWRIGIAYHSFGRMLVPFVYYKYYRDKANTVPIWLPWINSLNSFSNILEVFSLVLLTYVSSTDNFPIHQASFITFQLSSMVYMFLSCFLFRRTISYPVTYKELISLRRKVTLLVVNYLSFLFAVYFYYRHNRYCEHGIYSLFAVCEYITVISNILFHGTFALDIEGSLILGQYNIKTVVKTY